MRNVVNAEPSDAAGPGDVESSDTAVSPVDFAFLAGQTFADRALEREVLGLFVEQARRVVPSLSGLAPREQGEAAHLLKGSARGIGAWAAAAIAESYEQADAADRETFHADLAATFAAAEAAIAAHLGRADVGPEHRAAGPTR